jgi:xanthine dehydrogenase YagS FAD-binding subunit
MTGFEYHRADSIQAACAQVGDASPAYAGGTDLLTLIKSGLRSPQRVIDVKRSGLSDPDAAGLAATPQLRHRATIAGNLLQRPRCWYFRTPEVDCWLKGGTDCPARTGRNDHHAIFHDSPCAAVHPSDLAAPLIALDAVVQVQRASGTRAVPVAELLTPPTDERRNEAALEPGEVITAIEIDASPVVSSYRKAMDRATWAFALAGAAVAARFDHGRLAAVRVVLSGVANTPHPAARSEAILLHSGRLDPDTIERAATAASEGAEPLDHNGYKRQLVTAVTRDALAAIADRRPS